MNGWYEDTFRNRVMTVEAPRISSKDRKEWTTLVDTSVNQFHAAIFAWPCDI